jgi:hypothetical protein
MGSSVRQGQSHGIDPAVSAPVLAAFLRSGAVLARLRALACPVVLGNMDAWLLAPPTDAKADEADLALTRWHMDQLSDSDRAFVHTFPSVIERSLGAGRTLLCFHGSPTSYHNVIVPTTPAAGDSVGCRRRCARRLT